MATSVQGVTDPKDRRWPILGIVSRDVILALAGFAVLLGLGLVTLVAYAIVHAEHDVAWRAAYAAARAGAHLQGDSLLVIANETDLRARQIRLASMLFVAVPAAITLAFLVRVSWRDRAHFVALVRQQQRLRQQAGELERVSATLASAAEERSESDALLHAMIASVPVAVALLDRDLHFLRVNELMALAIGQPESSLIGRSLAEVLPELAIARGALYAEVIRSGVSRMNVPSDPAAYARFGKDKQWVSSYFPLRQHGEIIGMGVAMTDVTAERSTEAQLHHAQKMEAVGRLASGVAHDFGNLVTVIRGYMDLVLGDPQLSTSLRPQLEEVRGAADRAAVLSRQLLTFSRSEVHQAGALDPGERLQVVSRLLVPMTGVDIRVECVMHAGSTGPVAMTVEHFEQVVMNLAINAIDAMPHGGTLTLSAGRATRAPADAGDAVEIVVRDTGIGMSPDVLQHIFEPFFTTKSADRGTGLGLATAYSLVQQYHGRISVESTPGEGTTFTIHLPVMSNADPTRRTPSAGTAVARAVVVVARTVGDRDALTRIAEHAGERVLAVASVTEAEALIRDRAVAVSTVICDIRDQPAADPTWWSRLAALRPELRLLLLGCDPTTLTDALPAGVTCLASPITVAAVRDALRADPSAVSSSPSKVLR